MNITPIFTSRKLEKTIDTISENQDFQNEYLGEWIANLFYVSHKKCWIIINKKTKNAAITTPIIGVVHQPGATFPY